MTAASPWSVKGIDPKAREVAKDLARRSGMTLGEWLNQMIIEGEADAPPFESEYRGPGASSFASRDFSPPGEPFRASPARATEMQRISRALDQLTARIEAAEHRSTLAISGIDQSVTGVLSRLEGVERDQGAVAARFDGALEEVRQAQEKAAEKMRRLVEADVPRIESMKAMEATLGKVAEKLYEGETHTRSALNALREDVSNMSRRVDRAEVKVEAEPTAVLVDAVVAKIAQRLEQAESRTAEAVRALETSFAGLDARLQASDARHAPAAADTERRFERLTADLSAKVDAGRAEMAERLREAVGGKLEQLEETLRDLSGDVEQGERRSVQAIDRMGREVMRIASNLGDRVNKVEARSAEAVEQVGGEMARIADAMEQRLNRQDTVQSQALEKLGGEIARIAEKLAERIANTERRSAQALDDVGDQLGRVTERLNQRYDRAQTELTDRIQQSEARTAKLLEEAQSRIDHRFNETSRRAALEAAAEAARKAAEAEEAHGGPPTYEPPAYEHGPRASSPFDGPSPPKTYADDAFMAAHPAAETFTSDPFAGEAIVTQHEPPSPFGATSPAETTAHDDFTAPPAPPPTSVFEAPFAPSVTGPAFETPPSSTRSMLDQARAAMRQASEKPEPRSRRRGGQPLPAGSVEAPPFEGEPGKPFGLNLSRKKKDGVTIRTALLASGTAAALAVTGAGAVLLLNSEMGATPERQADQFGVAPTAAAQNDAPPPANAPPTAAASVTTGAGATPVPAAPAEMAVALTPPPGAVEGMKAPAKAAPTVAQAPEPAVHTPPKPVAAAPLYSAAVRKIESGDASGLEDLKRAANLGHPAAQFYLAKLYETGNGGLKKDLTEARRWTERAADGGDVAAMHNLGLYYYEGEAGPQDSTKAAQWFRKAADEGVKDSQYNLALLYAKGYGVPQNPAEAYKWYLIAAANGDAGAKTAAEAIRGQLTAETQTAAERSAAAFHAQSSVRTASAAHP
jgi:localization factor PodJL